MDSGATWRLGRRAGLDGLRGVAILLVLACHLFGAARGNDRYFAWGSAGVTLFFTLSGFLITSILLEGEPLGTFYVRRVRRLFPALALVLVVLGGLMAVSGRPLFPALPVLAYYANWSQLAGHDLGIMRHAWSLAIEEQFYLVWPVVLLLSRRWRNGALVVAVVGLTASTVLRFALIGQGGERLYYGTDTQAAGLLVGAVVAILAHRGKSLPALPSWSLLLLLPWVLPASMWMGWLVVPTVVPVLAAGYVWSACSSTGGFLHQSWLRYLGQRSYGIYLWHYPVILLVRMALGPSLVWGLVAVLASAGIAELSWRFVEVRFRSRNSLRLDAPGRRSLSAATT